jgi:hypothetical protein
MRGVFFGGTFAGFVLGLGLGLLSAWILWPIPLANAHPADLRLELKDDYIVMIASSYSLDGDLARAMQRLAALDLAHADESIARVVKGEQNPLYQQALIHLALDLKEPSAALARPTLTPRPAREHQTASPSSTSQPRPAATIVQILPFSAPATLVPTSTSPPPTLVTNPDAPLFRLKSKTALRCSDTGGRGVIELDIRDKNGLPLPGIGVEVNWAAGDAVFYTGFMPEQGMGYADMEVSPGTYNVRLVEGARSEVIDKLQIDGEPSECTQGAHQVRGWRLTFEREG